MNINKSYSIQVLGDQIWDPFTDNIDIQVLFNNGRRYGATLFTLANLESLFRKSRESGEYAGGLYLWADAMIILKDLSMQTIETTVADLIENGGLECAFRLLK